MIHNVTGIQRKLINLWIDAVFFIMTLRTSGTPLKALRLLTRLSDVKNNLEGYQNYRLLKANGRYYWSMHMPGFPSNALNISIKAEMNRIQHPACRGNHLNILFLAITKKCPLNCKHCLEWDRLSEEDTLSIVDLKQIISNFRQTGVSHIHLSGGEPMARYHDLPELVKEAGAEADVWISTSGYGLTSARAIELKHAGLTGIAISVDHYDSDMHNAFRGNAGAFGWAMSATENCRNAGLITCWSVCTTREFLSTDNLLKYVETAKSHGVAFVQLLEPMAAGRYKDRDVALGNDQKKTLRDFCTMVNTSKKYKDWPMISYIGMHDLQNRDKGLNIKSSELYIRKSGLHDNSRICLGAGNRYAYVDSDGNLQPCPFCHSSRKIPVIRHTASECLGMVKEEGCYTRFTSAKERFIVL